MLERLRVSDEEQLNLHRFQFLPALFITYMPINTIIQVPGII